MSSETNASIATADHTPATRSRRPPRESPVRFLLTAAVVVALLGFLVVEVYDLDVWWHLAIGREILAQGAVPSVDAWTVLGAGRTYHDSHWLFQAALALSHRLGGWIGAQALTIGLWSLTLAGLWRLARRRLGLDGASLVVLVAGLACTERFLPRPELVTFAGFTAFLLWFADERRTSPRRLVKLGLLQVVWTNSHGLFVLGPFVALTHLGADCLSTRRPFAALRRHGPALGVSLVATLVHPLGLRAWEYAALLAREARLGTAEVVGSLGELASPFSSGARDSPAMWGFYGLLVLGAVAVVRRLVSRRFDADLFLALVTGLLATTGRRNVVLYALATVPLLADLFSGWSPPRGLDRPLIRGLSAAGVAALAFFPLSGTYYLRMEIPARFGLGVSPSFFPHTLAPHLASGELGRGLLASNTLGGFVSFHGAPATLPLTDGRWEVQDPEILRETLAASRQPGRWRALVSRHELDGLLLAHTSPEAAAILPEIARDPAWRLSHLDAAASLWVPAAAGTAQPVVDLSDPHLLDTIHRPEDGILLAAFAAGASAVELECAALERTLAFGVRRAWLLERLGPLQIQLRRYEGAEATFAFLLELEPEHEVALNEMAFLAHRRGDDETALALLDRLLRIAPHNPAYRQNRERIEAARRTAGSQRAADP